MTERTAVAILVSGRGSNARALIEAAREPDYPATVVGVLSDRGDAGALGMAEGFGVPAAAVERGADTREDHERRMEDQLSRWRARVVCLAGFMRVLSPPFTRRWEGRLLNIHPSLLPAFPGLDTHGRALARGVQAHGCTVHLVNEGVDEGPILAQGVVPVHSGDTADALAARVLAAEHRLYPRALADWLTGRTRIGEDGTITRTAGATALLRAD